MPLRPVTPTPHDARTLQFQQALRNASAKMDVPQLAQLAPILEARNRENLLSLVPAVLAGDETDSDSTYSLSNFKPVIADLPTEDSPPILIDLATDESHTAAQSETLAPENLPGEPQPDTHINPEGQTRLALPLALPEQPEFTSNFGFAAWMTNMLTAVRAKTASKRAAPANHKKSRQNPQEEEPSQR
eukprot:gene7684-7745_t